MRQRTFFSCRLPWIGALLLLASLSTSCHIGFHGFHHGHHHGGHVVVHKHYIRHHHHAGSRVVHRR